MFECMEEFDDAVTDGGLLVIGRRHRKLHGTKKGVAIVTRCVAAASSVVRTSSSTFFGRGRTGTPKNVVAS